MFITVNFFISLSSLQMKVKELEVEKTAKVEQVQR